MPKIALLIILFCLVVVVYFSGITGFLISDTGGRGGGRDRGSNGPGVSVEDFREIGEPEVTGDGGDTGPGGEEDTPDEGADNYYGGGGGG